MNIFSKIANDNLRTNFSSVASVFKPLQFISPYRYIYEILIIAQWVNVEELG